MRLPGIRQGIRSLKIKTPLEQSGERYLNLSAEILIWWAFSNQAWKSDNPLS